MRNKASFRYQLSTNIKPILWFYGIYLTAIVVLTVFVGFLPAGSSRMNGWEMPTGIFLFVLGCTSFKENFAMLVQNGVSRRSVFWGRVKVSALVALGMAVIDRVLLLIFQLAGYYIIDFIGFSSLFETVFPMDRLAGPLRVLLNVAQSFSLYFCLLMFGYFITLLFYRLPVFGKVAVGAGVPIFFTVIFPILDLVFTGGQISIAISQIAAVLLGLDTAKYWPFITTSILAGCLWGLFSWLLMRRAIVKGD